MHAEFDLLHDVITDGMRVIDVGCGTGRHLLRLGDRLRLGLGVDYEHHYVEAAHSANVPHVHFLTCDATAIAVASVFDFAMCVTNTWGTMSDRTGVLREMRRLAPIRGSRLLTVYSEASVPARREWYRRLGHAVLEETPEYLLKAFAAAGGRCDHEPPRLKHGR